MEKKFEAAWLHGYAAFERGEISEPSTSDVLTPWQSAWQAGYDAASQKADDELAEAEANSITDYDNNH